MEKWEIRPPLPQKPLNRSSPKYAWVIMSGTPTSMQNFITIQLPPFAPQICENAHQVTRLVFTALHVMRAACNADAVLWWDFCPSVPPSVRLSVCHTRGLWQNGRKIGPDLYTIRKKIYPSFMRRRIVGGGDPFYVKSWVNRPPLERNRRFSTNNRS